MLGCVLEEMASFWENNESVQLFITLSHSYYCNAQLKLLAKETKKSTNFGILEFKQATTASCIRGCHGIPNIFLIYS